MATSKKKSTAIACGMPDDWQAQSDLRTLAEARAIKSDPKRLKAAQEYAQKQMVAAAQAAGDLDSDD
ncbi:hypothetical protein [Accumulibacter sp.]|uniref:hypothetical protein n=1 Tax=Accumulibacter sp. TaxID=2053492 RepID=UPI002C5C77EF|nr:hypothetical protein [Accumulibacter sp.]HNB69264.1 hypothetical protein [Accumulibacter sp.]